MKCQNLFSEKNKKKYFNCCLLKILPRVLSAMGLDTQGGFFAPFYQEDNFCH